MDTKLTATNGDAGTQTNAVGDCTLDVLKHKRLVSKRLMQIAVGLIYRASIHDDSKLEPPEKAVFDRWMPGRESRVYGTPEYEEALAAMGEGLDHHYAHNSHHPQHFPDGVDGMNLLDVIEMVCDWQAESEYRQNPVNLSKSTTRFNLSPQLVSIIEHTLKQAGTAYE